MILARNAAIPCIAVGIALGQVPGVADRSLSSAMAQEPADSIDLNGEWQFENEVVQVTHGGTAVQANFIEGAECFDGQVRPYFLAGELSGTSLTGHMMVCSRSPELVEACGISSMYETTFEATVEPGRIAGTRVAQGLATEEEGGRYTSCVPDSRYDGTYPFEGRSCSDAEREAAELLAQVESVITESNAIADQLSAMPPMPHWFEEGYAGPHADLAARWRAIEQEMLQLSEQYNATQDAGERATIQTGLDALQQEIGTLEDVLNTMNATNWLRDDYIGPNAELASRWRALDNEAVDLVHQLQEAEERRRECPGRGEGCPSPAEAEDLWARVESVITESNAIADQLSAMPPMPHWFEEGYAGPHADLAARWRAIEQEMLQLSEQYNATQDAGERATIQTGLDALQQEIGTLEDVLNTMNATNWLRDDYIGPNAELASRWRALDNEAVDLVHQLQEVEERQRECEEAVG